MPAYLPSRVTEARESGAYFWAGPAQRERQYTQLLATASGSREALCGEWQGLVVCPRRSIGNDTSLTTLRVRRSVVMFRD
jgi:hypothetical protein